MNEWALMNKLPNELLVEGRLALTGAIRLGLITQFQYEEVGLTDKSAFRYLNSCKYDNVPW